MDKKKHKLLSLCIITKNEEQKLPTCLEHVQKFVDEIIIVDTGSSDNTVGIAKHAGAKVYKKKWKENFSEIRNYAIEKAAGKWILFLDADEFLLEEEAKKIRSLLANPMAEGYLFYINTYLKNHENAAQTQALRLFRNRKEYRYQNRVYERIPDELITSVLDAEITIYHYPDFERHQSMQFIKVKLLTEEIEEQPNDSYLNYVYGIELLNTKKYKESIEHLQRALKYVNNDNVFTPHLYKLIAWTLLQLKNYREVIDSVAKGLRYFPFYTDLVFLRGKAYQELSLYKEAIKDFEMCLQLGDAPVSFVSEAGFGSFKTLFALGEVHEQLLNSEKALEYYKQAYNINKNFEEPLYQIGTLVKANPRLGKIDIILLQFLDLTNPDEAMTLIDILCLEKEFELALLYIDKVTDMVGMNNDIAFVKGLCYMMTGKQNEAETFFSIIGKEHPFYDHVLLRRIQNYWFHDQWKQADQLIKEILAATKLNEATKKVYLITHSTLKGDKPEHITLDESGYVTLAKLLEYLLVMKKDIKENNLLNWLLQSKHEDLFVKIGEIFALNQDIDSVLKIFNHIQDKQLQSKYREQTANRLYEIGNLELAEQVLSFGGSQEFDVLGHYLWHKIWLQKILNLIDSGIRSRKINKKEKEQLSQLAELISSEN